MKKCGRSDEAIIYMNKVSGFVPKMNSLFEINENHRELFLSKLIIYADLSKFVMYVIII